MGKDNEPKHMSAEDALISHIIEKIEHGDAKLAIRVFGSLQIDGQSHPSLPEVKEIIHSRLQERKNAKKH